MNSSYKVDILKL